MNTAWRPVVNLWLLGTLVLYVLLPTLGLSVWHRVIPEHDHLWIGANAGQAHDDAPMAVRATSRGDCPDCNPAQSGFSYLHVPNATSAFQAFAMFADVFADAAILLPLIFPQRISAFACADISCAVLPLERPPIAA